jgi:hypothetical protein
MGTRAAQALKLLRLQDSQQLGLEFQRDVPDLVEEKRALMRQLKASEALRQGPGEGAALVAKQLALQQPRWQGDTIHRDERVMAPPTLLMDGAGNELFACAGFPLQEHSGIGGCHDLHLPRHFLEGNAFTDNRFSIVRNSELILAEERCLA